MRNKLNFSVLSKIEKEFGNFEIGQTWGGGNPVYLRFGYWNRVDVTELNETAIADAIVRFYTENKKTEFEKNVELEKEKFSWEHFIDSLAAFEEVV